MRSSKQLKDFTRSIAILLLALHAFVLQSFIPVSGSSIDSSRAEKLNQLSCLSSNLCPSDRTRFKPCREDETLCKCICQFKTRNEKHTPSCSNADIPVCPGKLTPVCSNPKNKPVCDGGILFCEDIETLSIDLEDNIFCK